MENEISVSNKLDFDTLQRQAMAIFKSRFFGDVKSEAQAIVKVMAGNELGIPPVASISGIHIVQGKPVLGANIIATLIDRHPDYKYRVRTPKDEDSERCEIEFFKNNESLGSVSFTMDEAKNANLTGKDNWKKYPSDMLFARAISRGARRLTPAVFAGVPVYTPDELIDNNDEVKNEIIDNNNLEKENV